MKHYPEHNLDPAWRPFTPPPTLDGLYELDDVALVELMARNHPKELLHHIQLTLEADAQVLEEAAASITDKAARNEAKARPHLLARVARLAERGAQLARGL